MAKKTKKHRFNVIDAILIIVILAVVAAAAFYFVRSAASENEGGAGKDTAEIQYEIKFSKVRNEIKDALLSGYDEGRGHKIVKSAGTDYVLGEIVDIICEDAQVVGTNMADGSQNYYTYPDHSDITIIIKAEAEIGENGRYSVDGSDISMGVGVDVKLPYFTEYGYCTRVYEANNTEGQSDE